MSLIKLDEESQKMVDSLYQTEMYVIHLIDDLEELLLPEGLIGKEKWFSIGRTDIEKGFMSIRKAVSERYGLTCSPSQAKAIDEYRKIRDDIMRSSNILTDLERYKSLRAMENSD